MDEWYENRHNVIDLINDLEDRGEIVTISDALVVVEKPWHYGMEYDRLRKTEAVAA